MAILWFFAFFDFLEQVPIDAKNQNGVLPRKYNDLSLHTMKFHGKQKHFNDRVHFGTVVAAAMEDRERRRKVERKGLLPTYLGPLKVCIDRVCRKKFQCLRRRRHLAHRTLSDDLAPSHPTGLVNLVHIPVQ